MQGLLKLGSSGRQFRGEEGACPSPIPTLDSMIGFRFIDMAPLIGNIMTSWPQMEPMQNNLVNYGVTDNGIAVIELCSDSAGEPLSEGKTSVNTYTLSLIHI